MPLTASFLARSRVCYGFSSNLGRRVVASRNRLASTSLRVLPTEDSVKNDAFMQQLGHASQIIPLLSPEEGDVMSPEDEENLKSVLAQQLVCHFHKIQRSYPPELTLTRNSLTQTGCEVSSRSTLLRQSL